MTNNTLYQVAKLGKPHSLRGFQYINIDNFFRRFDLSNISMQVGNEELIVENFKTHLKDRNLIKFKDFDTIESIERLRDNVVSISDKYKNDFLNDSKLPWPGFFNKIKKSNHLNRLVTLSPLTDMAYKFHIKNGAKLISVNETTQNFEYKVIKNKKY